MIYGAAILCHSIHDMQSNKAMKSTKPTAAGLQAPQFLCLSTGLLVTMCVVMVHQCFFPLESCVDAVAQCLPNPPSAGMGDGQQCRLTVSHFSKMLWLSVEHRTRLIEQPLLLSSRTMLKVQKWPLLRPSLSTRAPCEQKQE